jgi:hypothetical protein
MNDQTREVFYKFEFNFSLFSLPDKKWGLETKPLQLPSPSSPSSSPPLRAPKKKRVVQAATACPSHRPILNERRTLRTTISLLKINVNTNENN